MNTRLALAAAVTLVVLAGCAATPSEPERIYSLPELTVTPLPAAALDGTLSVQPLSSASIYADRRMAWRDLADPLRVRLLEKRLWSTPPPRLVQEQLIQCLEKARAARDVVPAGVPVPSDFILTGQIGVFDLRIEGESGKAVTQVDLLLAARNPRRLLWQKRFAYTAPLSAMTADAAVEAFAETMQSLCQDTLAALAAGG